MNASRREARGHGPTQRPDVLEIFDQTRRSDSSHYWDEVLVGPTEEDTEREAAEVLVGLPLRTRSDMLRFLEAVGYLERSNEPGIERWAVRALPSRVDDVLDGRWYWTL